MKLTPAMEQFMKIKNEHPDCVLFFRMGDFYETFFDDAKIVSKVLNIVLTARGKDKIPLAGIPYHSIDPYIAKLVKNGHKVAMVEQLEDPKKAKGIVKRGLVRIITPGTVLDSNVLDESRNNFLVSVVQEKGVFGVSAIDLSTGDFVVTEVSEMVDMINEVGKFNPSEVIIPPLQEKAKWVENLKSSKIVINSYNDVYYYLDNAKENLKKHFDVMSLAGFGVEGRNQAISSAGAIISYLKETQMTALSNITSIRYFQNTDFMIMDSTTIRNLELFTNVFDNTSTGTLVHVLDQTKTPMGARLLRSWLSRPLKDKIGIDQRQQVVEEFVGKQMDLEDLRDVLKKCLDIQRLLSRVSNNLNCPKDLLGLKKSLQLIPELKNILSEKKSSLLDGILPYEDLKELTETLDVSINEESPVHIRDGGVIKSGCNSELDEVKSISLNAKRFILDLEAAEREKTGIKSLKIKYNRVFGYFIEVTKSNLHLVPDNYIRKQTQVNAERFITPELKEYEETVNKAKALLNSLKIRKS